MGAIKLFYNDFLRKNYKLNYLFPDRPEKNSPLYWINPKYNAYLMVLKI